MHAAQPYRAHTLHHTCMITNPASPHTQVLKYLPGDKAKDAKSFMMTFQYWLGGSPENLESMLLNLADNYVTGVVGTNVVAETDIVEPILLPDTGIWHPLAPRVFEDVTDYLQWYAYVPLHLCPGRCSHEHGHRCAHAHTRTNMFCDERIHTISHTHTHTRTHHRSATRSILKYYARQRWLPVAL